eukprot:222905-Pelagomonas_calceolata.AAC.4
MNGRASITPTRLACFQKAGHITHVAKLAPASSKPHVPTRQENAMNESLRMIVTGGSPVKMPNNRFPNHATLYCYNSAQYPGAIPFIG